MPRTPALSVVVPLYNEAENLAALCAELESTLGTVAFEAVFVDDGSTDGSVERYTELEERFGWLRVVRHPFNAGQSAAFCTGVAAARGPVIATIDGDLQNDPADIPRLLDIYLDKAASQGPTLVVGNRTQRQDSWLRRVSSRVANRVRSSLLRDDCMDTGCSLKIFSREAYLLLPQFDHMHRFLPALFVRDGAQVVNVPVAHRERRAGDSKYGIGNRLWVGIIDLFGARWLLNRRFRLTVDQRLEPRRLEGD